MNAKNKTNTKWNIMFIIMGAGVCASFIYCFMMGG